MRRVTATIPSYWLPEFEKALEISNLDGPEFIRTAVYERVKRVNNPTAAVPVPADDPSSVPDKDLYMKSAPESLKALSPSADPQVCVRGQEIGEDHIIEPGDLYSWFRFSRDSQADDWVKNGKLCRECHTIAKDMWARGEQYF